MIPESYEQWRHCITVICGERLTPSYIATRLQALQSRSDRMTARFVALYGEAQHARTVAWFERAQREAR